MKMQAWNAADLEALQVTAVSPDVLELHPHGDLLGALTLLRGDE